MGVSLVLFFSLYGDKGSSLTKRETHWNLWSPREPGHPPRLNSSSREPTGPFIREGGGDYIARANQMFSVFPQAQNYYLSMPNLVETAILGITSLQR